MSCLASLLLIGVWALSAQTKKILVDREEEDVMVRDLQSVSPKAKIVAVNKANVMKEIGDADAFIGNVTPAEVRAGKNLKWVQVMSSGGEKGLFLSGDGSLRYCTRVL